MVIYRYLLMDGRIGKRLGATHNYAANVEQDGFRGCHGGRGTCCFERKKGLGFTGAWYKACV